jgi:NitT/TauT family transport system substrate-binding protein
VRVAVGAPTENIAPLLLADRLGEFAAENLSVELVSIADPAEAYAALADGEVDVVAGDIHAAFLDTVTQGAGARWALGGSVPSAAGDTATPQAGLWLEPGALERAEQWTDLEGHRVVVDDGIAGAVVYPIHNLLRQRNTSLNAVRVEQALGDEAARRLLDGEVAAAWLESPHWRPVAARGVHQLVTTRPPIEPIDGMVFAEPLLDAARQRDVGVAFSRAIIRTINTYLAANYGNDPDVIAALAEVTGVEDDALGDPPLVFDWELRDGTLERMQRALIQLGAVTFEQRVEDRRFVDRSLYQEAVEGSPTGELATRRGGAGAYDQLQG